MSAAKPESHQVSWMRQMLAEHPALLFSGLYLTASLIGLVYSWIFFGFFDINIFRYAEISDFLLASLKEPFTWILTLLAMSLVWLDNSGSRKVAAKGPGRMSRWYASPLYRKINYFVAIGLMTLFLYSYADKQSKKIRSGTAATVTVRLADGSQPIERVMLGTTTQFSFFYDTNQQQVTIYPHESVLSFSKTL